MERDLLSSIQLSDFSISTHTLTWSVTVLLRGYLAPVSNFNSHAHVERDSTDISAIANAIADFNSHAHVERD